MHLSAWGWSTRPKHLTRIDESNKIWFGWRQYICHFCTQYIKRDKFHTKKYIYTLKTEAARSSEMIVNLFSITRRHIPENTNLHYTHCFRTVTPKVYDTECVQSITLFFLFNCAVYTSDRGPAPERSLWHPTHTARKTLEWMITQDVKNSYILFINIIILWRTREMIIVILRGKKTIGTCSSEYYI